MQAVVVAAGGRSARAKSPNRARRRRERTPVELRVAAITTPTTTMYDDVAAGRAEWPTQNTATPPRPCPGIAEPRPFQGARRTYPSYYVQRRVRFDVVMRDANGHPLIDEDGARLTQSRTKRICYDCHCNELHHEEQDRLQRWGYGTEEKKGDEKKAEAGESSDASASGQAIEELGNRLEHDAAGELGAVELEERDLLPEDPNILLAEMRLGVMAAADRAAYDKQIKKLGAAWEAELATAVDPAAIARLVAFATPPTNERMQPG